MYHFFCASFCHWRGERQKITGADLNHMKNVLRMKTGEAVLISDGTGKDYNCQIESYAEGEGILEILSENEDSKELPSRIWLFQGLPKSDKMEVIIQKAVELGAAGVIPVATRNAVVKLDAKKSRGKGTPLAGYCRKCSQAVKAQLYPTSGNGDELKRGIFLYRRAEI